MFMSDEPKRRRKKKTSPKVVDEPDMTLHPQEVKNLIDEILQMRVEEIKKIKSVEDTNNALVCTIGEFLNSFMLIGYDNEGTPLAITKASTPLESDALHSLLVKFVSIQMNKFNSKYGGEYF
jgi:hypothetical protein